MWFWVGGRVLERQPPQLEADPHHQPQLTSLDRLAPRTSLGSAPLTEIKYCEDTRPEQLLQQLQAAHAQHGCLGHSIAGDHVLHVILLGVGGLRCRRCRGTYIPTLWFL